jgi:glycosyltransferase involved in cell wall biosynthesis
MKVLVSTEHRFDRTPDGRVWTQTMFAYPFWTRYLQVFDQVRILARVRDVETVPSDWQQATGLDVSFAPTPYYLGPKQYLLRVRQVRDAATRAVGPRDAVILRLSSPIAASVVPLLRRTGHPYGAEVVGDPYDVFAPGAVRHPLRPFCRWWFPRQLRRQCATACAAAYVTEHTLQRRYPVGPGALSTSYSSVELPDAAFVPAPRAERAMQRAFTLITVGSLAQMYKAPDVLIDAVALCVRQGLDLSLILVGDGKHRPELEARASALGLGEHVCFRGQLTAGGAVRSQLDRSDLFVLPSRTEGLPRAMIEAMARALPCIGTRIGGIPELLPEEDLVPPGDATALAQKIQEVLTDPARLSRMSATNLQRAQSYHENVLSARRMTFYRYVRERTAAWLEHR